MVFVSLHDLCKSPLAVELCIDIDNDFAVYFEDHGMTFNYKIVEESGVKGVNL